METQKDFVNGLSIKKPRDNAPEFVKASISIKREDLIAYLQGKNDEWLNVDVKESKKGSWYCEVNNWRPNQTQQVRQDINEQDKIQSDLNNFDQQPTNTKQDDNNSPF